MCSGNPKKGVKLHKSTIHCLLDWTLCLRLSMSCSYLTQSDPSDSLTGFENFYPKGKGNPRPNKDGKRNTEGENMGKDGEEGSIWDALNSRSFQQTVLFSITLSLALAMSSYGQSDVQEISFQKFKNELLANDLVDKLEVS